MVRLFLFFTTGIKKLNVTKVIRRRLKTSFQLNYLSRTFLKRTCEGLI